METAVVVALVWAVCGYFTMKACRAGEDRIARRYPILGTPEEQREKYGGEDFIYMIFIFLGPLGLVSVLAGNAIYFSGRED